MALKLIRSGPVTRRGVVSPGSGWVNVTGYSDTNITNPYWGDTGIYHITVTARNVGDLKIINWDNDKSEVVAPTGGQYHTISAVMDLTDTRLVIRVLNPTDETKVIVNMQPLSLSLFVASAAAWLRRWKHGAKTRRHITEFNQPRIRPVDVPVGDVELASRPMDSKGEGYRRHPLVWQVQGGTDWGNRPVLERRRFNLNRYYWPSSGERGHSTRLLTPHTSHPRHHHQAGLKPCRESARILRQHGGFQMELRWRHAKGMELLGSGACLSRTGHVSGAGKRRPHLRAQAHPDRHSAVRRASSHLRRRGVHTRLWRGRGTHVHTPRLTLAGGGH